jgi:hypothetical protein
MRFLWVDEGNDPDWAKVAREGMTGLFFPLRDDTEDIVRRLKDTKGRGLIGGVYGAWNWGGLGFLETDGAGFAEWVDSRLKELVAAGLVLSNSRPRVQLNNERHEKSVILSMLRRWRELRPKHDTSWTMEGGQGGWMGPIINSSPPSDFVTEVISHRVRLAPQLYNGAMTETWDSLAIARDLIRRGFPDGLVSPFYDAAKLGVVHWWDGFAFTQGRLA